MILAEGENENQQKVNTRPLYSILIKILTLARGGNGFYKKVEGHQINFERGVNVETTSFGKVATHQVIPGALAKR